MYLHWFGRNIWSGAEQFWAEMWQPQEQEMSSLTFEFWKFVQKSYLELEGFNMQCASSTVFLFHLLFRTLGVPCTWNIDCHIFHKKFKTWRKAWADSHHLHRFLRTQSLFFSSRYFWKCKSISNPTHHFGFKWITCEARWSLAGASTPSHSDVRRLDLNIQNIPYMHDADLAKENPISSQQHPLSKGLKCGPAWRPMEYPKEQQSPSAGSCSDKVWLLFLVESSRQKSSWQFLSVASCCLESSQ